MHVHRGLLQSKDWDSTDWCFRAYKFLRLSLFGRWLTDLLNYMPILSRCKVSCWMLEYKLILQQASNWLYCSILAKIFCKTLLSYQHAWIFIWEVEDEVLLSNLFLEFLFLEARDFPRSCSTPMALFWHDCCTTSGRLQFSHTSKFSSWMLKSSYVLLIFYSWLCLHIDSFHMKSIEAFVGFSNSVYLATWKHVQEIVSIYPSLSPPTLSPGASNRVCNALALLQVCFYMRKKEALLVALGALWWVENTAIFIAYCNIWKGEVLRCHLSF